MNLYGAHYNFDDIPSTSSQSITAQSLIQFPEHFSLLSNKEHIYQKTKERKKEKEKRKSKEKEEENKGTRRETAKIDKWHFHRVERIQNSLFEPFLL